MSGFCTCGMCPGSEDGPPFTGFFQIPEHVFMGIFHTIFDAYDSEDEDPYYMGEDPYYRCASNGVHYGTFREKSDAALQRELSARDAFQKLVEATPGNATGLPLL